MSTPLSELSPPPEEEEEERQTKESDHSKQSDNSSRPPEQQQSNHSMSSSAPVKHEQVQEQSESKPSAPPITPQTQTHLTNGASSEQPASNLKVAVLLEINSFLLKITTTLHSRGILSNDARSTPYTSRLSSNLSWMATSIEQSRSRTGNAPQLPVMDPPPPTDIVPMERLSQLYSQLSTLFAKDIVRRKQLQANPMPSVTQLPNASAPNTPNPSLKRDRVDESITDPSHKRRNTGDPRANAPSMMPPSTPSLTGHPAPNPQFFNPQNPSSAHPTAQSSSHMGPPNTTSHPVNDGSSSRRSSQPPPARQMSPPNTIPRSSTPSQRPPLMSNSSMPGPSNQPSTSAGGSGAAGPGQQTTSPNLQQAYQILNNPAHPFVVYMNRSVPGFSSLPPQQQVQRMMLAQREMQRQREQQQQQASQQQAGNSQLNVSGMGMQPAAGMPMGPSSPPNFGANASGSQFSDPSASSLLSQQGLQNMADTSISAGNPSFPPSNLNQGIDPRSLSAPPQGGFNMGEVNMSNMTAQQRQLLLMRQQRALSTGAGGQQMAQGMGGMSQQNPQQAQPPQPQRRVSLAGSPTNPTSTPLSASGESPFPPMRAESAGIPGIARTTRSPSEGGGGGARSPPVTTPRPPVRQPSAGQEDFQRAMLMQAAQAQAHAHSTQAGQIPRPMSGASFGSGQSHGHGMGGQGMGGMGAQGMGNPGGWSPQNPGMGSGGMSAGGNPGMGMGMGMGYGMGAGAGGSGINPGRMPGSYSNNPSQQQWQQQPFSQNGQHNQQSGLGGMPGMGGGQYPFSGGSQGDMGVNMANMSNMGGMGNPGTPRLMSATQGPGPQIPSMGIPSANMGLGGDGGVGDLDIFNWAEQ